MHIIQGELAIFLISVILGLIYAIIYDAFIIIREKIKHFKLIEAIEDLMFWILVTITFLVYIIYTNQGQIRIHILFGTLCGVMINFTFITKVLRPIHTVILDTIIGTFDFVYKYIRISFNFVRKMFEKLFDKAKENKRKKQAKRKDRKKQKHEKLRRKKEKKEKQKEGKREKQLAKREFKRKDRAKMKEKSLQFKKKC